MLQVVLKADLEREFLLAEEKSLKDMIDGVIPTTFVTIHDAMLFRKKYKA